MITVVFYTSNTMKSKLFDSSIEQLLRATKLAGDLPIISVSQEPMSLGKNICIGKVGVSTYNLYKQVLIGAKEAKTPYVAMAEDDTLYSDLHFSQFDSRYNTPNKNAFTFNMSRWSIYTWTQPPMYSLKFRQTNNVLIAPRELLIEALEKRYEKYPDPNNYPLKFWAEPGRYEGALGIKKYPTVDYFSSRPVIMFSHPEAMGYHYQGERKRHGMIRAYDIPYWGRADKVMEDFYL